MRPCSGAALLPGWSAATTASAAPVLRCGHTLAELYRWWEKLLLGLTKPAPAASDGSRLLPAEV